MSHAETRRRGEDRRWLPIYLIAICAKKRAGILKIFLSASGGVMATGCQKAAANTAGQRSAHGDCELAWFFRSAYTLARAGL